MGKLVQLNWPIGKVKYNQCIILRNLGRVRTMFQLFGCGELPCLPVEMVISSSAQEKVNNEKDTSQSQHIKMHDAKFK